MKINSALITKIVCHNLSKWLWCITNKICLITKHLDLLVLLQLVKMEGNHSLIMLETIQLRLTSQFLVYI